MIKFINRKRAKRILKNKQSNNKKIMLNIGCGTDYKTGWINIDNNSDIDKLDINWDLKYKLPFPDNSVDFIYNEHFLEHLTVEQGLKVLKDFKRILKIGGVLRVAMPDLKICMEDYFDADWKNKLYLKPFEFVKTKAELINISFRWWGHKYLYDAEELERRLKEAGFEKIKFCKPRESDIFELQEMETRDESTLITEVEKESPPINYKYNDFFEKQTRISRLLIILNKIAGNKYKILKYIKKHPLFFLHYNFYKKLFNKLNNRLIK